jgi:hypothetical protein
VRSDATDDEQDAEHLDDRRPCGGIAVCREAIAN